VFIVTTNKGFFMNKLIKQEWYQHLVEECKAIITEAVFTSRWALVEGYHVLGKRMRKDNNVTEFAKGSKTFVQDLARNLNTSDRTIYYALQAFDKYPDIQKLPEGKNITWNKLITKYLPKQKVISEPLIPAQGKYQVIAIDPPWPYGTEFDAQTRRVASPYKELSIEKLADFTLPADDNCVLWLWTTHKFLFDSFHLMKIWEFEYKLTLVWDKQKMGMGAWLRCQAEFCLLGIKGKPKWELTNQRDFISAPRREHSRKPDEFYKLAETLWPEAKRIDIFSREKRPGWEQYGNEPNKLE